MKFRKKRNKKKNRTLARLSEVLLHTPPPPLEIDCLNCGNVVQGSYCMRCGQPVSVSRYTFNGIGKEIYDQFKKFEFFSALRTFWALLHHPGKFVRGFLDGKRVGYVAPFKYFFYSFVLRIFVASIIHTITGSETTFLTGGSDLKTQLVDLMSVGFWGLCWRVIFRSSELNAAENVVAAIYFTGQVFILTLLVRILFGPFMDWSSQMPILVLLLDLVIYLGYSIFFTYRLFRETGLKLVLKQLILGVVYILIAMTILFATALGESLGSITGWGTH